MITPEAQKEIEKRTIEEISSENKKLLDKIKHNSIILHMKKTLDKSEKEKQKMKELLEKPRKTFAFHIISKDKPNLEEIHKFTYEFWKKLGKNILKYIILNDFIYIKSKENIIISQSEMGISETCTLSQVNPKDIIKLQ